MKKDLFYTLLISGLSLAVVAVYGVIIFYK